MSEEKKKLEPAGMYETLIYADYFDAIEQYRRNGLCEMEADGSFGLSMIEEVDNPWIHITQAEDRLCSRWHDVYFGIYGFISRRCFNCWKIVVKPKTLKDLMKIREVQQDLGWAAKCGIERRPYVSGLYGAFWYCPMEGGLAGARERWKKVRSKVWDVLGVGTTVVLKRACTEFERKFGPSDKWQYPIGWRVKEDILDKRFKDNPKTGKKSSKELELHILKKWIEFAWEHGDSTWKEYSDGRGFPTEVFFSESSHADKDYELSIDKEDIPCRSPRSSGIIELPTMG